VARSGLVTALVVTALATTACTLPEAPEREERTNALAAHGSPYPTLAEEQPGAPEVDIVAKVEPAWEKKELTAKAGVVNVSFTSPAGGNHNLNIVGPGAPYPLVWGLDAGAAVDHLTKAVTLQRGTYTFYCSVQGHRSAGMEGKLVVS
jgi:plastocyanin